MSEEAPLGPTLPFAVNWLPNVSSNGLHLPQEPEPEVSHSWRPIDLTAVLDGTHQSPQATIGARNDGVGLFYPGRVHTIASEPEGGKTWFALIASAHEIANTNHVIYLDFEDDEGGVVNRLLILGSHPDRIREYFHYINPDQAITVGTNRSDLETAILDTHPTLTTMDGVTEAMSLHGLEYTDNTDVATFGVLLPRKIAGMGPAVSMCDHVTKDKEGRGRWAIGGQHKLAGLNGAAYTIENRNAFGIGLTGRSTVRISKDRPAQLRRYALPQAENTFWFADLVIESHTEHSATGHIFAPTARAPEDGGFRPTFVMAKISKILARTPGPLTGNTIAEMVKGNRKVAFMALELLVVEGYVRMEKDGRAHNHIHVKPFEEAEETPPDNRYGE